MKQKTNIFLLALVFALSSLSASASTLTFTLTNYFSSPFTNTGVRVYPISTPINVDGSFTITGLPIALTFNTNTGVSTTNLMQGNYLLTNTSPLIRMLFAVPVSTNTYEVSQLAISGFNTYNYTPGVRTLTGTNGIVTTPANGMGDVLIDGAAFAPTSEMITNALGFFPLSPTQVTNVATNSAVTVSNNLYALLGTAAFSNSTAFYLRSNPSNYVSGSDVASSNYLTASSLTTLATKTSLTNATNAIYTQLGTAAFSNSTDFYLRSNPSNFAQASITNNLASIGYALNLATNATNFALNIGLLNTNYSKTLGTNSTNYAATLSTNSTNFTLSVGTATTNYVLATSNALRSLNTGNFIANTNGTGFVSLAIDGTFSVYSNQFNRKTNFMSYGIVTNDLRVSNSVFASSLTAPQVTADTYLSDNFSGNKALITTSDKEIGESAVTDTELGYVSGVTNAIQTQINSANALITTTSNGIRAQVISRTNGIAQTTLGVNGNLGVQTNVSVGGFIQATNISASRALVSDAAQRITNSVTTSTELAQLSGVTGNVQTNFNGKLQSTNGTAQNLTVVGDLISQSFQLSAPSGDPHAAYIDADGIIQESAVSQDELNRLVGVTGGIQTNIDSRVATINGNVTNLLSVKGNASVSSNVWASTLTVTNAQTNLALSASAFVTTGSSKQLQSTAPSSSLALTLSDETGTGSVVFSNAPVITSPTLTTVTATDSLFNGTNAVAGDWAYVGTNITSVVNGKNVIDPGTNVVLRLTGTPTTAWTLVSFPGGRLNRILQLINGTGYAMTIENESGSVPTAADRIVTGTGADVILTNNPGFASFTYDDIASRWVLNGGAGGGGGSTETASNLGGGYPTFDNKTGVDLRFNTFTNGSGIQISSNANLLTISTTGTTLSNFNVGQFNTASDISIADGALVTNLVFYKTNLFKDKVVIATNLVVSNNVSAGGTMNVTGNITNAALTASRAVVTDANKALASSATTATELGYVNGVTSAIQTQLDAKSYTVFAATNVVFSTNLATSTEYTILPATGYGTTNLPANFFYAGRNLEIDFYGDQSDDAGNNGVTFRVYLGTNLVASFAQPSISTGPEQYHLHVSASCYKSGASGLLTANGYYLVNDGGNTPQTVPLLFQSQFPSSFFNTTISCPVTATTEFTTSDGAKVISNQIITIKAN